MVIFAAKIVNNMQDMLQGILFKEEEIPFKELEEVGITKEEFYNLPIHIINSIMLGRLSPVMLLKMEVDGTVYNVKGKFAFERKKDSSVCLKIYPVNKKFPYQETFSEEEIQMLKEGRIIKAKILDNGKKVLSYIQLDPEINTLVSVPVNRVFIPSLFDGKKLEEEEVEKIKNGDLLEIEKNGTKSVITIDLLKSDNLLLIEPFSAEEWRKQRSIEWDRITLGATGYWLTSENGWDYQEYIEKSNGYKR